jgi:hypothetical protein
VADNTTLDPGTGGDTIRDKDRVGIKTPIVALDINPAGAEVLGTGDATNGLDVDVTRVQGTVTVAGAVTNVGTFAVQDSQKVADNAGFTDGTTPVQPAGYVFDEVAGTALTENDAAAARIDSKRAQIGVLEDATTRGQRATVSAGGALKVDNSAVTQPVSGTVTATLGATTNAGATAKTSDYDTGAGTDTVTSFGIALPASGGAVQGGTATNPVRTDPTGTTTQPVSGTVTANAGSGTFTVSGTVTANAGTGTLAVDTELPAAAALADAAANPTAPGTGAFGMLWNGATWDRAPGGATNGLTTNLKALNGTTVATNSGNKDAGTQRVVIATDQVQLTNALKVDPSAVTSPVSIAASVKVNAEPETAGGLSIFHLVSAATTNATNIKASAGQVYGWYIYNSNAAARKVAFHNTAGTPTAGASVSFAIVIPPTSAANVEFTNGIAYGTGIAITTVTDLTDAGATAVAASDLIINIFYK